MAGIYIHIPFCKQACYYCDFHFSTSLKYKEEMILAICKEIELKSGLVKENVETIYFGGGTPSLLLASEMEQILEVVYKNFEVIEFPEITLEANPDDLSLEKIEELATTKINRLSIGVQSFFEEDLQFMNRAHTAKESEECIVNAKKYFKNITIDLIYGVPNTTNGTWKKNLEKFIDLDIPHLSSYALTVEENTALAHFIKKGKYPAVDEVLAASHFQILNQVLKNSGYIAYEISNFGKPEFFSKHNTAYWQGKTYLGIGPSAHSFDGKNRSWNIANNLKYIQAMQRNLAYSTAEKLTQNNVFNEMVMTRLRTVWGISLKEIENKFGQVIKNQLVENATKHINNNKLRIEGETLKITEEGKFFADGIAADLFIID